MKRWMFFTVGVVLGWGVLVGCEAEKPLESTKTTIDVWFHTGQPAEKTVIEDQVRRFNRSQDRIYINLTLIPEGDYNTQVQAAATDNKMPDLLDLDGPYLYNYAWKGHLLPLDNLVSPRLMAELLPSILAQGTYRGRLYSIGTFDSGLGLFGNGKKLRAVSARLPTSPEEAWSIAEFNQILSDLGQIDEDGMVLDLRMDYRGEWYSYAFSPALQSGGGDLINRRDYQSSEGILNGPAAKAVLGHFQSWFKNKYIDVNTDANSFTGNRVALSWCGHWEYPRYKEALGDDLLVLPLPDFGRGAKTGMGSWSWAITSKCRNPELAMEFLEFLLEPAEVIAMANANGAVPATRTAIGLSPLYRPGAPLHLFARQLEQNAIPRPRTPAYPIITSVFQQVFQDIRYGADITGTLDRAVKIIDQDIRDNHGYPDLDRADQDRAVR